MARSKRQSKVIAKAKMRNEGIKSINPAFEVTAGLTVVEYSTQIALAEAKQSQLNIALGNVDTLSNDLDDLVIVLLDYDTRFLGAVGSQFGKNSSEYEKAGGKRRADYKRKKKAVPVAPVTPVAIVTPLAINSTPPPQVN